MLIGRIGVALLVAMFAGCASSRTELMTPQGASAASHVKTIALAPGGGVVGDGILLNLARSFKVVGTPAGATASDTSDNLATFKASDIDGFVVVHSVNDDNGTSSATVSFSGQRVATIRRRRSSSAVWDTTGILNGRIAVWSWPASAAADAWAANGEMIEVTKARSTEVVLIRTSSYANGPNARGFPAESGSGNSGGAA
jgi:hypothetical protein